ncbi:transposase family protein [Streptomyces sp. NRRL S-37]|uniref:transposase family protein n=1 Tax=Streptomyces sp. NRRL S-37 TaxID=1463903 RepID=UPI001F1AF1E7|nr:transposase family protein [Streptomyces sp. NRRL S-37]
MNGVRPDLPPGCGSALWRWCEVPTDWSSSTGSWPPSYTSGKNKQNAVGTMVVTDEDGRVLFRGPAKPGSCADITHARRSVPAELLADGPAVEILAGAGYPGLGAQTDGRVITPSHRKFKKNAPDRHEEMYERQRKAHSSRRIRVERGIAHSKNWRAPARHLGRREHMSHTVQAIAGLLPHQQTTDLTSARPMWTPSPTAVLGTPPPTVHGLVSRMRRCPPVISRQECPRTPRRRAGRGSPAV